MSPIDIVQRTRDFVNQNFLYARPDVRLADDDPLFESGVVDSMGAVELVQFLQETFGIQLADDDITEQHFRSLQSIADLVCAKGRTTAVS